MTLRDVPIPFHAFASAEGLDDIEVLSAEVDGTIHVVPPTAAPVERRKRATIPVVSRPGRIVIALNMDRSRSLDSQVNAALARLGVTCGAPELVRLLAEGLDSHGHDHHPLSDLTYWSDIDVARGVLATHLDLVLCQHLDHSGTGTVLSLDLPAEQLGPAVSALSWPPAHGERVLLTEEGVLGSPHLELASAAAAHAHRVSGRAEAFPGQQLLADDLAVVEVLARTAIDRVPSTQGAYAEDAVLRAFGYVRPRYVAGDLTLSVGHDDPKVVTPWEVRYCRPCCE